MLAVRVQVICTVFTAFPPSSWFKADNPVPFALAAFHVIAVTAAAAFLLNRAVKIVLARIGRQLGRL